MSRKVRAVVLLQPWNAFIKHLRDAGSLINLLLDETFRDLESEGEKLVAAMRILDGKLGLRVDLTDHSESRSTVQLRAQDLKRVPFQEDTFFAVKDESGEIWVQAKPVAETLGLRWHGQFEHIQRDEALRDTIRVIRMVSPHPNNPQKAITREALFVTLDGLTLWLAKLQPSRIKNEAKRARVVRYQKEAGRALRNYFFRGAAVNPRAAVDTAALATAVREAVARALEKAGEETAVEIEQLRVQRLYLLRCFFE